MSTCNYEGCDTNTDENLFLDGTPYCSTHYHQVLENRLMESFEKWNPNSAQAPSKFRYFLGRLYEEQKWTAKGDSFLSQYRIKKRAYDFIKTEEGCEFKIERHLNTWEGTGKQRDVIEYWKANIEKKTMKLLDRTSTS